MATTCPIDFDVASLREAVTGLYSRLADDPTGDFHFHRGPAYAIGRLGYLRDEVEALPLESTECFAGVGNPLAIAPLDDGDVVLDHACGAGMDLLLAARRIGPRGHAIGVDLTEGMRARAWRAAKAAGLAARVDIRAGLLEELPVESGSVDVVLSNGVLNLATDKQLALAEVARVLRPGGRLLLADVVVRRELSARARQDPELWASCIAGALREEELGELARAVGLVDPRVVSRFDSFAGTSAATRVSRDLAIASINFFARKPNLERTV
jgi:arsenite methyltransferase